MNTINDAINNNTEEITCSNEILEESSTSTTSVINNLNVEDEVTCNNETELVSDVDDCTLFYLCLSGIEKPVSKINCPKDMWFDLVSNTCIQTMPVSLVMLFFITSSNN